MPVPYPNKTTPCGHSANVVLRLHVDDSTRLLADAGPEGAALRTPGIVPAGKAVLEIITDGRSWKKEVTVEQPPGLTTHVRFV